MPPFNSWSSRPGASALGLFKEIQTMPAYNFQTRFAPLVMSGKKQNTIRGREAKIGSLAYLFTGMRTKKCQRLGRGEIVSCTPISLGYRNNGIGRIKLRSRQINMHDALQLAYADGFATLSEMIDWFAITYMQNEATGDGGFDVYHGFLITWKLEA
jgi:hypothetical protein